MYGFKKGAKPKAQKLADGGMVKGPGTGTSDSITKKVPAGSYIMPADSTEAIGGQNLDSMGFKPSKKMPVNLSNGEFELPPEQVHAIGVQALDQMKDATHTPAAMHGAGFKPQHFFADGGEVDPKTRRPVSPANTFPASQNPKPASEIYAGMPTLRDMAPQMRASGPGWRTESVLAGTGQDMRGQVDNGEYAKAAGTAIRGTAAMVPAAFADAGDDINRVAGPIVNGAIGFGKGLLGIESANAAPPPNVAAQPAATKATAPAPQVPATAAASGTAAQPAGAPATPAGNINVQRQANGVLEFSGQDVGAGPVEYAGDSGFKPRGGTVNTIPAANFMGGSPGMSRELGASRAAAMARGDVDSVRKSYQTGGGTFNSETALGTAMRETQQALAGAKGRQRAALVQQMNALQGQQDAAQRGGIANAELGLRQQDADMKREAQGFQTRAAQRLENLYAEYEAAKTPEARANLAEQIRVHTGKAGDEWQSVALQGATDATGNKTEGVLAAVNKRTGEMRRFDAGQSAAAVPTAAVSHLKANPQFAAQFDAKYGAGAAKRALAQ